MYLIRDGQGAVYNEVNNPTVIFDSRDSVLLKIGERESMEQYFGIIQQAYRSKGFGDVADDIILMELPKEQEEIDKVFQICDYIGVLYKRISN